MSKSFRVAVLGPRGQCRQCVVDELLSRGHTVMGISRSPPSTWPRSGDYSGIVCDFGDIPGLSAIFSEGGFDAVVSAFAPPLVDLKDAYRLGVEGHGNIKMAIVRSTYRGPVIIIGGAGSLYYKNCVQLCDDKEFAFKHWYAWPYVHMNYMATRMFDHRQTGFGYFIQLFKWASQIARIRDPMTNPLKLGFSWLFNPWANLLLWKARQMLTNPDTIGLIFCSRVTLSMWEGLRDIQWSFLSPPWQLRDKGIRTGKYDVLVDDSAGSAEPAINNGIYNEDMAVAIVDEVENKKLEHKHWTCTGPVGLREW